MKREQGDEGMCVRGGGGRGGRVRTSSLPDRDAVRAAMAVLLWGTTTPAQIQGWEEERGG